MELSRSPQKRLFPEHLELDYSSEMLLCLTDDMGQVGGHIGISSIRFLEAFEGVGFHLARFVLGPIHQSRDSHRRESFERRSQSHQSCRHQREVRRHMLEHPIDERFHLVDMFHRLQSFRIILELVAIDEKRVV